MDFIITKVVNKDKSQQVVLEINFSTHHVSAKFQPFAGDNVEEAKEEEPHD